MMSTTLHHYIFHVSQAHFCPTVQLPASYHPHWYQMVTYYVNLLSTSNVCCDLNTEPAEQWNQLAGSVMKN